MGLDLYNTSPAARAVFDTADAAWPGLKQLCFEGPAEQLHQTLNTQPCLFTADLACARALEEAGVVAQGAAGFSLGEIPAACFTQVMSVEEGFALVQHRARAMHQGAAEHPGLMYAVLKLPASQVEQICRDIGPVYPVNYNCPSQTVVACAERASAALIEAVKEAGGKTVLLKVSGAFHSPWMDQAAQSVAEFLVGLDVQAPAIPLYANVTGTVYTDPRALIAAQVNHPVLWQRTIENMIADGFDTFIEVGPGKTLSSFIERIDPSVRQSRVSDSQTLASTIEMLHA
jgi:[acyl-carrier-protein] S-malonyltransferase